MSDRIEGFEGVSAMHETERDFLLSRLPKRGRVLEIGTLSGVTVAGWARALPDVEFISVDPFRAAVGTGAGNPSDWVKNAGENQLLIAGTLDQAYWILCSASFNFILVDGEHSYDACLADCRLAQHLLTSPASIMAVHDYGRPEIPGLEGVTRAVLEFCLEAGFEVFETFRHTALMRRKL